MERASIEDLEPDDLGGVERHALTGPLGTTDVAINRYRLAPGEGLPGGLHAHADQEEVFVVVEGAVTFETLDGLVDVGAGEAVRFAPGEFQTGRNDAAAPAVVFALGAPRDTEDVRVPLACPDCGHGDLRPTAGEAGPVLVCPACGAETTGNCPACEGVEVRVVLADDGETPGSRCQDCAAEWTP